MHFAHVFCRTSDSSFIYLLSLAIAYQRQWSLIVCSSYKKMELDQIECDLARANKEIGRKNGFALNF